MTNVLGSLSGLPTAAVRYKNEALNYCSRIKEATDDPAVLSGEKSIAIGTLIPGLAFRETSPFQNDSLWSPFEPIRIPGAEDQGLGGIGRVPRKGSAKFAEWLSGCLRRCLNYADAHIHILVIGDGEGDAKLANTLSYCLGSRGSVQALIYNDRHNDTARTNTANTLVRFCRTWQNLAHLAVNDIERNVQEASFVVFDVDRTLLLPRGLCDTNYERFMHKAFAEFLAHFTKREFIGHNNDVGRFWSNELLEHESIRAALAFGGTNESYLAEGDPHHKDEEVRAAAALAYLLLPESQRDIVQATDVKSILKMLLAQLDDQTQKNVGVLRAFDIDKLQREVRHALVDLELNEPSFFPLYRMYEERALHQLADAQERLLNGHALEIITKAVRPVKDRTPYNPRALPVAFSDRPGNSVGLRLAANRRARPQRYENCLIERPLLIKF